MRLRLFFTLMALAVIGMLAAADEVEDLIEDLKSGDRDERVRAAEALGWIEDPRTVDPLVGALKDEEDWVRAAAARSLGEIGDPRAVDPLIETLKDREAPSELRRRAAWALSKIGDQRGVDPLIQVLKEDDEHMHKIATEGISQIGEDALDPLIEALKDDSWIVRGVAAEALVDIGDAAIDPLIETLKEEDELVRWNAAWILDKIGGLRADEALAGFKEQNRPYVFIRAVHQGYYDQMGVLISAPGKKIQVIGVEIENHGHRRIELSPYDFSVIADQVEYKYIWWPLERRGLRSLESATLLDGEEISGSLSFEVPRSATISDIIWIDRRI